MPRAERHPYQELDPGVNGGQAGASARIENYLGFPTGISGMALMARAFSQAQNFGAEMAIPVEAVHLECVDGDGARFRIHLARGERVGARAVIVARGARYRRLNFQDLAEFEGAGVHYGASPLEASLCAGQEVMLVGGGNSAGQAVAYLSSRVAKVPLVVCGRSLDTSMSRYLVERIAGLPNVEVALQTEVVALEGRHGILDAVRWRHVPSGAEMRRAGPPPVPVHRRGPEHGLARRIGRRLDGKGFVLTGADAATGRRALETSRDGVFAVGDV